MAYITANAPLTAAAPALGFFEATVARIQAWRMYCKTVAELSALSDRELDDIGITRGSIPHYARAAK
jgi:uncharacterized protein YjiS (DUF1127 family)